MRYLEAYLGTLRARGNAKLAESVAKTAEEVGNKYIKNFSFLTHEIGLLFGNVQSGKTGQMFGIMCKAADYGFPAFLLLTTDNVVLQQQTLKRVQEDLSGFCICGENDSKIFMDNSLKKPVIVVLKKNSRMLKLWANIFNNTKFMTGNPLFIVDDEADASSLNTLVNKAEQSAINKHLDTIKNGASSSIYLQVTGTPQALFLQSMVSGWHPTFTYYFRPGEGYLGGNFFFKTPVDKQNISFIHNEEQAVREMIIHHLAVSAVVLSKGQVCNCIIHPGARQKSHNDMAAKAAAALHWCLENLDSDFKDCFQAEYAALKPQKYAKPEFEAAFALVKDLLEKPAVKILIMNDKNEVVAAHYETGSNIIVGGNTLGRGVTFPKLHTIYYTRTSKKPQADTMWQHSRMFGYDRDPGLVRLYIDGMLFKLFSEINTENNSLIEQIESGFERVKISFSKGIAPTRRNVLDNKKIHALVGGANYYPFNPDNNTIEDIDRLLQVFDEKEQYYQVNLRLILQILEHIISDSDFNVQAFKEFIEEHMLSQGSAQGILIVRRGRNVAKGTGALLSPNDWDLGKQFTDKVVVTMYKVTGTKGWGGKELWIPNIKLPDGRLFYNVEG